MNPGSTFYKLLSRFSPNTWLLISALSLVTAVGSSVVLLSRQGMRADDAMMSAYDWVRRFSRDTVRLTFKTDEGPQETVFVAPRGILEQATAFKGVEKFDDFVPPMQALAGKPVAPLQVLDSEWTPIFSGKKQDVDS
jgi:hypothetical protein